MPFDVTTIDLVAERERLTDRRDDAHELAQEEHERADETDDEATRDRALYEAEQAAARASDAEQDRRAVVRLIDDYGADAELRVGGLTMNEKAWVDDRLGDIRETKQGSSIHGVTRKFYAGAGLVAAPFLPDDVAADAAIADAGEQKVAAVGDEPAPVIEYLYRQVDSLTTLSGPLGSGSGET